MHYLRDYAQAVAHEASVKPIRGTNIKPYGIRREGRWFNISKASDESIVVRLYDKDLVRFQPNGTIIASTPWRSWAISTRLWQVLGARVKEQHNHMWVHTTEGWVPVPQPDKGGLALRPTPEGYLAPVKPVVITRHRINRKAKNAVMARYKPFIDYLHVVAGMGGEGGYSQKHIAEVVGTEPAPGYNKSRLRLALTHKDSVYEAACAVAALMRDETTPDAWSRAAMDVLAMRGYPELLPTSGEPHGNSMTLTDRTRIRKRLVDMLMHAHRDEVFVEYVDTSGEITRDEYAKFFDV